MIKDIKYTGYATVPSDYLCPDGQLAAAINLAPEDGSLNPVSLPVPVLDCCLGGHVLTIHHVTGQDNYIIKRISDDGCTVSLYYLPKSDDTLTESEASFIAAYGHINDISIIGNTLIIATDLGLRYLLYRNGTYLPLGSKPPFVSISFGMTKVSTVHDSEDLNIVFERSRDNVRPSDIEQNSNAVYGLLLSKIKEEITSKGFFYTPFFVRYAFRLFDGSYSWHSAPVLMLPSVIPPLIKVGEYNNSAGTQSVPSTLSVDYFSLDYKIIADGIAQAIEDWKDIIVGIDVFISAPIPTFDQSERVSSINNIRNILLNSYFDYNPEGIDPRSDSFVTPSEVFVGHYASVRSSGNFIDWTMSTSGSSGFSWQLPLNSDFHEQIRSASAFYRVASISFSDISPMEGYKRLPLLFTDLSSDSIVTRLTLADDYQSHCRLVPQHLFAFNSRLHAANINLTPAPPFTLASCVQATSASPSGNPPGRVIIKVYTKVSGIICSVESELLDENLWDLENSFPRYIFYPDASAYKMELTCGSQHVIIDLIPHDFLNGAYWYGTFSVNPFPANAQPETLAAASSVSLPNKVYVSEVGNPFLFPALGIVTVGNGSVIGISTAAKALSQGQFGQFPLYAFTSEGIWALEVSSTGSYSARQPVSRDVCISPESITQIDGAVLFASARGIMLISGSNTQCISDAIATDASFSLASLPSLGKALPLSLQSAVTALPFSRFLGDCRMLYDYTHQRIIVFSGSAPFAYMFSLKSKEWSMVNYPIKEAVNSYPDALALGLDGRLVDFSALSDEAPLRGLLVSRPLKLDYPDVLKTVDTAIHRGHFAKGHVQTLIYGSRDLDHWHLVSSSVDHYLRGFRGTPYKYFRFVCVCSLSKGESLSGATVQFTPRLADQPR